MMFLSVHRTRGLIEVPGRFRAFPAKYVVKRFVSCRAANLPANYKRSNYYLFERPYHLSERPFTNGMYKTLPGSPVFSSYEEACSYRDSVSEKGFVR